MELSLVMLTADETKLGGMSDRSEGCAAMQRDLTRLQIKTKRSLIKFNRKCKVLYLWRNNLMHRGVSG